MVERGPRPPAPGPPPPGRRGTRGVGADVEYSFHVMPLVMSYSYLEQQLVMSYLEQQQPPALIVFLTASSKLSDVSRE